MARQFIKIGDVVLKKSSVVMLKKADMLSPQHKSQVQVRITGRKDWAYIATEQTIDQLFEALNAD